MKFPFQEIGKSYKLAPIYRGPFEIMLKIIKYEVKLKIANRLTEELIHIHKIKIYHNRLKMDTSTEYLRKII